MTGAPEIETEQPLSDYHAGMLTLLTKLADAAIEENIWDDMPPALWCVDYHRSAFGDDVLLAAASLSAWEMPLRREVWQGVDGVEVLNLLTEHLEPVMRERRADGLAASRRIDAVALVGEAWTLRYPDDATAEQREAAQIFSRSRGTADHPWAVEAKTVMAVSADGWRYNIIRARGSGDGQEFAEPPGGALVGRYPIALEALLAAMRARP
jgi:hypothetical protein